jgi:N-acetylmuramic acid 6-phosphate etherase
VRAALPELERAVEIEGRLAAGARVVYAGTGTSGRPGVKNGAELTPTFSWPRERLLLAIAGRDQAMMARSTMRKTKSKGPPLRSGNMVWHR